jgi:hypothetical protein
MKDKQRMYRTVYCHIKPEESKQVVDNLGAGPSTSMFRGLEANLLY